MSQASVSLDLPVEAWGHRAAGRLRSYVAVTDPRSVLLLVFTTLAAGVIAGGLQAPGRLVQVGVAVGLSCMGARAVANYIDRDIDELMERTRGRSLPSGALEPVNVLILGLSLIVAGLIVSLSIGAPVTLLIACGLADNLVVYSLLTKRRSPLSIVWGAPSGGIPAMVGYVAIAGRVDLVALMLMVLVMLWTPIHIWSLAIRYRDDYARADVPMLPVVVGVRRSARYVGYASIGLVACTLLFVVAIGAPLIMPVSVALVALAGALLTCSLWLVKAPTGARAWRLFKLTSPYIALLFTLLAVNTVLVHFA